MTVRRPGPGVGAPSSGLALACSSAIALYAATAAAQELEPRRPEFRDRGGRLPVPVILNSSGYLTSTGAGGCQRW